MISLDVLFIIVIVNTNIGMDEDEISTYSWTDINSITPITIYGVATNGGTITGMVVFLAGIALYVNGAFKKKEDVKARTVQVDKQD